MTEQTKAQRLADTLERMSLSTKWDKEAAAELRRLDQSEREGWRYADELEQERKRLDALNAELVEALLDVTASLVAAHNLLQNGGKKAAASDKMFSLMLNDYEKSFELGRAVLAKAKEQTNE